MALQVNLTYCNIPINGAYVRVKQVEATKNKIVAQLTYHADKDSQQFDAKAVLLESYELDGANPFVQVYEHLKTLPEFVDAVDC